MIAGRLESIGKQRPFKEVDFRTAPAFGCVLPGRRPAAGDLATVLQADDSGPADQSDVAAHDDTAVAIAVTLNEVVQLARFSIDPRRHRAAVRHDQQVALHQHVPLRGNAGLLSVIVIDPNIGDRVAVVVRPEDSPGLSINSADEDTKRRPDSGPEVNHSVGVNWTTAHRPERNEPRVSKMPKWLPFLRSAADFPDQLSRFRVEAVKLAIVRAETDSPVKRHRCQPDRAVRVKPPQLSTRSAVKRGEAAVDHRADKQPRPEHDRLVRRIEMQPGFVRPGGHGSRKLPAPLQMQLLGKFHRGGRAAYRIVSPHRPVRGSRCG